MWFILVTRFKSLKSQLKIGDPESINKFENDRGSRKLKPFIYRIGMNPKLPVLLTYNDKCKTKVFILLNTHPELLNNFNCLPLSIQTSHFKHYLKGIN